MRYEIGGYSIVHPGKTNSPDGPIYHVNLFDTDNRYAGGVAFFRNDQELDPIKHIFVDYPS